MVFNKFGKLEDKTLGFRPQEIQGVLLKGGIKGDHEEIQGVVWKEAVRVIIGFTQSLPC